MINPFVEEIALQVSHATNMPADEVRALLETPPRPEMGDRALPCFALEKTLRKAPHLIARELAAQMATGGRISEVRPTGPYLNFFLSKTHLIAETLSAILDQGAEYGRGDEGVGKTVVIDFSHPNIAKPFGIHHLRSTVIGNALRNIYRALGYKVVGVNHLGDWGAQFAKLILAWNYWGEGEVGQRILPFRKLLELYVRIHEEIEGQARIGTRSPRVVSARLEAGDEEAVRMWARVRGGEF